MPMGQKTHYEILGLTGRTWAILEVKDDRNIALSRADELWGLQRYSGIRVVKESFTSANNEFSSVEIFNRGHHKRTSKHDQTGKITPCLSPKDLYSSEGRRSIWDLLHVTLSEWNITPTELLHNLVHYERLYNNGVKLQNAVQRTAVAFEDEQDSIQTRMQKLYKVIDTAVDMMRDIEGDIPSLEMGRLKPVVEGLEDKPNRKRLLLAALSEYLRPAVTLGDKFGRTVIFLSAGRPAWATEALDQLIAELLQHTPVIHQVLGGTDEDNRVRFMHQLAYLYVGELNRVEETAYSANFSDDIIRLNSFIADGKLPETSRILWARLKAEVSATKPFIVGALKDHLKAIYDFREEVAGLPIEITEITEIDELCSERMTRLVNSHVIGEILQEIKEPCKQIKELLELEKYTTGAANKRTIANCIMPILTRPDYEAYFAGLDGNPLQRMPILAELQKGIMESEFSEMHKRQAADKLDSFCKLIMSTTQVLKKLHGLNIRAQEKTTRLLSMIADGFFTDGECKEKAEEMAREYLKQPGFTEGLITGLPASAQAGKLMEFKELLERAQISRVVQG